MNNYKFLDEPSVLPNGLYFQLLLKIKLIDDAIIRSNEPEEVLTYSYEELGNRFVIPWRKVKGKFRRIVMEEQRRLGIYSNCHLKDDLCMKCPSCFIFGGTGETSSSKVRYNIVARILGETFISIKKIQDVSSYTQNAVDEKNYTTGQALMTIVTVPKETEFLGTITIKDPTLEMISIIVNNINRFTRIGARSVEWGRINNEIIGYKFSNRETITAYDLLKNEDLGFSKVENINNLSIPEMKESYEKLNKQLTKIFEEIGK